MGGFEPRWRPGWGPLRPRHSVRASSSLDTPRHAAVLGLPIHPAAPGSARPSPRQVRIGAERLARGGHATVVLSLAGSGVEVDDAVVRIDGEEQCGGTALPSYRRASPPPPRAHHRHLRDRLHHHVHRLHILQRRLQRRLHRSLHRAGATSPSSTSPSAATSAHRSTCAATARPPRRTPSPAPCSACTAARSPTRAGSPAAPSSPTAAATSTPRSTRAPYATSTAPMACGRRPPPPCRPDVLAMPTIPAIGAAPAPSRPPPLARRNWATIAATRAPGVSPNLSRSGVASWRSWLGWSRIPKRLTTISAQSCGYPPGEG
jgi:hypothetical protein